MLDYLPLDIWGKIAALDVAAWTRLYVAIPEMKKYTKAHIADLIRIATRVIKHEDRIEYKVFKWTHRGDDLPAIEWNDGRRDWYHTSELHRTNGPAIVTAAGEYWMQWNKFHREDGPAITCREDGKIIREEWFIDDQHHRDGDLPAVTKNGKMYWYKWGKLHREGNPAIVYGKLSSNISEEWFKWGRRHRGDDLPAVLYRDGGKKWYDNGVYHRMDGPAISKPDCEAWYYRGKLHRIGGPAWTRRVNGVIVELGWHEHGVLHRVDGPAENYSDMGYPRAEYHINGIQIIFSTMALI